jgi:single-stranded-DNA-specific exonuclease
MMTAVGLKMMNEQPSLWVRSFQEVTGNQEVKFSDLGFNFGPRINAAGRLDSADPAVEFLLEEEDEELSIELALKLEGINTERKDYQQRANKSAIDYLVNVPKHFYERIVVVEMEEQYHSGIAGLVASNLSGKYNVPAIVLCHKMIDGVKHLSGSCRSVEGISILDILINAEKKLGAYRYGGHDAAAGLTIKADDFDLFRDVIIGIANNLPNELYAKKLFYDIEIPISNLDYGLVELIENSFHKIRLYSPDNEFYSPAGSLKNLHGLLFLAKDDKRVRAITFNRAAELLEDFLHHKPKYADVVYEVSTYGRDISYRLSNWEFKQNL